MRSLLLLLSSVCFTARWPRAPATRHGVCRQPRGRGLSGLFFSYPPLVLALLTSVKKSQTTTEKENYEIKSTRRTSGKSRAFFYKVERKEGER